MKEEKSQGIQLLLELLKTEMKNENLIFGFAIDKKDINDSKLCIIEKERYLENGKLDGISISLTELNKGLL